MIPFFSENTACPSGAKLTKNMTCRFQSAIKHGVHWLWKRQVILGFKATKNSHVGKKDFIQNPSQDAKTKKKSKSLHNQLSEYFQTWIKINWETSQKLFSQVIYKITIKVPITFDANRCKLNNPKIHMEPQGSAIQMKNIQEH